MSRLVVGLSHRGAAFDMLERVAVSCTDIGKVALRLLEREHVAEAMLLSTCNRVEVYAVVTTFHDGLAEIIEVLTDECAMTSDDLTRHLYLHYAEAGVEHLFSVAAGLDSMVVGEPQILGQLRGAYVNAQQASTVGRTLHEVGQHALRLGRRVHSETGVNAAGASVLAQALAAATVALAGPYRTRSGGSPRVGSRRWLAGRSGHGELAQGGGRRDRPRQSHAGQRAAAGRAVRGRGHTRHRCRPGRPGRRPCCGGPGDLL
jgi:glutamyl-tRNA reductase